MKKTIMKNLFISSISLLFIVLFTGCAKNDSLILNTYSPPNQMDKVKELMAKGTSKNSYLDLYIHDSHKKNKNGKSDIDEILNGKTTDKTVAESLVANVKSNLTQTNFIGINQNRDSNTISLEMKIVAYDYKSTSTNVDAFLQVSFTFTKDETGTPIFNPTYEAVIKRQSSAGKQSLPSKAEVLSILTKDIASELILDISPLKARKLVELKSLPQEIAYTIQYAKMKNYKGAINAMENYKGNKTMEFYFNLAIYYEALASTQSDLSLLSQASENYDKAMAMGGSTDEIVIKAKAKFDNFYELIKAIDEQKKSNQNANLNRDNEVL